MKIFRFLASDPSSDDGYAVIIVRATRYSIARRYVTDEQKKLGRTDLEFELAETLGNRAIIYSNMERNHRVTPNAI